MENRLNEVIKRVEDHILATPNTPDMLAAYANLLHVTRAIEREEDFFGKKNLDLADRVTALAEHGA